MPPQQKLQPKPPGLNVIALVSGGKDSLYSILHCIRNGHTVVALANLYPKPGPGGDDDDEEDTDSFMYQTIGHSVIPLYEAALGVPLYREHITGGAVDTSRVYRDGGSSSASSDEKQVGGQDQDETESLTPLLKRVMANHPEANAVSAGAILSTYQRTRIENVAGRLGLTPLAWLWMYPSLPAPVQRRDVSDAADAGLLEDMAAVGCEARIIKVASGGLDEGVLWEDVSGPGPGVRGKLVKAMKRFCAPEDTRGAVLGEGGEYESLALDGPGFLWEKRIVIEEREGRTGEGGVGFMRLKGAKCVVKEKEEGVEDVTPEDVRRPALLDGVFGEVLNGLLVVPVREEEGGGLSTALNPGPEKRWLHCEPSQTKHAGIWKISNLTAPEAGPGSGAQMQAITDKVKTILSSPSSDVIRSTNDIVFATVLLRSMADFTHMNNIYNTLFRKPNPPARATIACGNTLPEGVNIMVSFVVDLGPRESRQGLHVQSRSYWAPANIGPYSQAMSIPLQGAAGRLVYIAGQIPLEPASMELVSPASASASVSLATEQPDWVAEYTLRTVLALQHLWRIGAAMQVDWWVGAIAYLTGEDDGHVDTKARIAWRLWEKMHTKTDNDDDEDEDEGPFDAWDLKYGHQAYEQLSTSAETPSLPNFNILQQSSNTVPPFFAAQVAELPRGSDIEWQGLGSHCDQVVISQGTTGTATTTINKNLHYTGVEISIEQSDSELEACLQKVLEMHGQRNVSQIVVYTAQTLSPGFVWPGQIVPCRGVWGMQGRRLRAGVVIQSVV